MFVESYGEPGSELMWSMYGKDGPDLGPGAHLGEESVSR